MKKEFRVIENNYYHFVNVNPKGKFCGDCVIRAISLACNQSWETTVKELTELGIKKGYVAIDEHIYPAYLERKGFLAMKEPRDLNNKKISVREFIDARTPIGVPIRTIVMNVGSHHVSTIIDNKVNDTWDCSKNTMHRYWVKVFD